jgi:hypothetical protein
MIWSLELRGLEPDVCGHALRVQRRAGRVDRRGDTRAGICRCRMDRPSSEDENEGGYDRNGQDGAHWSSPLGAPELNRAFFREPFALGDCETRGIHPLPQ